MQLWKRRPLPLLEDSLPILPRMHAQVEQMRRDLRRLCAEIVAVSVALERVAVHLERLDEHPALVPPLEPKEFSHEWRQR